jgi:hypothetical protein
MASGRSTGLSLLIKWHPADQLASPFADQKAFGRFNGHPQKSRFNCFWPIKWPPHANQIASFADQMAFGQSTSHNLDHFKGQQKV